MKKLFFRAALLLMAGAAVTSCTNSDNAVGAPDDDEQVYTLTIDAAMDEAQVQTRGTLEQSDDGIISEWTEGDVVEVRRDLGQSEEELFEKMDFLSLGELLGTLKARKSGKTTTLTGQLKGRLKAGDKLRFDLAVPRKEFEYVFFEQKGTLDDIAKRFNYSKAFGEVARANRGQLVLKKKKVSFDNSASIVRFKLKNAKGQPVEAKSLKVGMRYKSDGTLGNLAVWASGAFSKQPVDVSLDTPSNEVYAALWCRPKTSGEWPTELAMDVTDKDGKAYYVKASEVKFEPGMFYDLDTELVLDYVPQELSQVTRADIGKVIGSDGKVHPADAQIKEGVTKLAVICQVTSTGHGLALEFNNAPQKMGYKAAVDACAKKQAPTGCSWRLPSLEDFRTLFDGPRVDGDLTTEWDGYFLPVKGFMQKCADAGLNISGDYWTSVTYAASLEEGDDDTDYAYSITMMPGDKSSHYFWRNQTNSVAVLACLQF